jgi:hypothetical protein
MFGLALGWFCQSNLLDLCSLGHDLGCRMTTGKIFALVWSWRDTLGMLEASDFMLGVHDKDAVL